MKKYIGLLLMLIVLTISATASPNSAPKIKDKYGDSSNWAGYAVTSPTGSVTDVRGSWTVPTVTCPSTTNQYSAFWIGIDGYDSGTVEQIGTSSDCNGGTPKYRVWYEFYPKFGYYVPMDIQPGDTVSARVTYTGKGKFSVSIKDDTTGKSFSTTGRVPQARRTSAEWIAEAPWSGGVLPLANFGVANFFSSSATIGGKTGSIGSFGSNVQSITMVGSSGVKAQPSLLSDDGTSFSVQWVNAGP